MKIIAFDVDGVILNSMEAFIKVTKNFIIKKGLPPIPESQYHKFNIALSSNWRAEVYEYLKIEGDPELEFKDYWSIELYKHPLKVYDGIAEAIKEVENSGYKTCVITNNAPEVFKKKSTWLPKGVQFDYIRSRDDDLYKPEPEYLGRVLEHFACQPADIIYIGDLYEDYEFAVGTGMNFIWASYGQDNGRMASVTGITKIDRPSEIFDMIKEFKAQEEIAK